MLNDIVNKAEEIKNRLIKFRREIHKNPELSGQEKNTAAFVAGVLEDNDIEVQKNIGGHGVVGLLDGNSDGRTIALRADMDALPMQDKKDVEYASSMPGIMHACGHDAHIAILLGCAIVLGSFRDKFNGSVKFIFQPAEEKSTGGAKDMLEEGVLENPAPSAILALHCSPDMKAGVIGHKPGIIMASADFFKITIVGKSGHAARPHQTVDAILVSSMIINAIHHIVSRRTNPLHPAVISIGTIKGGNANNIIADHVEIEGTVRALAPEVRKKIPDLIEETIKGVAQSMDAKYEFVYDHCNPPVINDIGLNDLVKECSANIVGEENIIKLEYPLMGAEDFAWFAEKIPGVLFRLGTNNTEKGISALLHSSTFDIDEEALAIGTKAMSWMAIKYLST